MEKMRRKMRCPSTINSEYPRAPEKELTHNLDTSIADLRVVFIVVRSVCPFHTNTTARTESIATPINRHLW